MVDFAKWFLKLSQKSSQLIIMTDEAYFILHEKPNRQNNRLWLDAPPTKGLEKPLYDEKILVFCTISVAKIYGPYYFLRSVNQQNYLAMLQDWIWPKHLRTVDYKKTIFSKIGPLHTKLL